MHKCIIIANGKPPKKKLLRKLEKLNYNYTICADGGANTARKLKIIPDLIVGDFDSITKENLNYYLERTKVIKIENQNSTDVEKALDAAVNLNFSKTVLLGAIGNRLDHSYANICMAVKYYPKIQVGIIYGKSYMFPFSGEIEFLTDVGETISMFGADPFAKFYTRGLKYSLNGQTLPMGVRESESNEAAENIASIRIENGKGIIFRELKKALKYDFI